MSSMDYPFVDPTDANGNPSVPAVAPQTGPDPAVSSQWSDALNDPTVRSSLLQFGISMLQPPSFGDSFGSQFGRAVGSAGEAQTARNEEARKQADSESRSTLNEARATSAETRAQAAQTRADASAAGLDTKRQALDLAQQRLTLSQILQAQRRHRDATNVYNKYVQLLPPDQRFSGKYPSFQEWATQNGYGDVANGPGDTTAVTATQPDKEAARAEGAALVRQRPDRAEAIRQRFRDKFGEDPRF